MKKETFIRLVGAIKESMDKNDKMDEAIMEAIGKYKPDSACFIGSGSFAMFADEGIVTQAVLDSIRDEMGEDAQELVEWWLYEVPMMKEEDCYIEFKDGSRIIVNSIEKLWEAITWTIS